MFIDRFIEATEQKTFNPSITGCLPEYRELLEKAVVFKVDNVANYYWQNNRNDWHFIDDMPNVAPVYDCIWFEWLTPANVCINGKFQEWPVMQFGYLMGSQKTDYKQAKLWFMNTHRNNNIFKEYNLSEPPEDIKWIVTGMEFNENKFSKMPILTVIQTWWVRENGIRWIPEILDQNRYLYTTIFPESPAGKERFKGIDEGLIDHAADTNIPSLALCFMHCKNTSVDSIEYDESLQKSRIKRGKLPLVRYHVLNIAPIQKILHECGSDVDGIQRAMHLCRGHFKDFTDGSGLFGKYHGLYWWDPQVRGKATSGLSLKDYKVNPN